MMKRKALTICWPFVDLLAPISSNDTPTHTDVRFAFALLDLVY
jgi:hypothetical protein